MDPFCICLVFMCVMAVVSGSMITNKRLNAKSSTSDVMGLYSSGVTSTTHVVVTGGNAGLGLETVDSLSKAGARVTMLARNKAAADAALEGLEAKARVTVREVDLASLESIAALADAMPADDKIDTLVLNAGIMATPSVEYTDAGFEKQIGVNHFGHVYLYSLLESRLNTGGVRNEKPRVVTLASSAHRFGHVDTADLHYAKEGGRTYTPWGAYGQSKLSNILFAKSLADKMGHHLISVAVHPGVIKTNLWQNTPGGGQGLFGWVLDKLVADKSVAQGAATTVYACTSPRLALDSLQGSYLQDCAPMQPTAAALDTRLREALWTTTKAQLIEALEKKNLPIPYNASVFAL